MNAHIGILLAVAFVSCLIMLAIDYSNSEKDKKSRTALLTGYAIVFVGAGVASWILHTMPVVLIYSAALMALVFFGRYLVRKAAGRKQ